MVEVHQLSRPRQAQYAMDGSLVYFGRCSGTGWMHFGCLYCLKHLPVSIYIRVRGLGPLNLRSVRWLDL